MHFSPFATVDDWSRQKPQTADNMFPTSLALPTQPIQQHTTTSSAIQNAVSNAPRTTNSYVDGQIQDFMPYPSFQPFDDLTMNHLHQSTKSPSQSSSSPQQSQNQQQQHPHPHQLQQQQQQTHTQQVQQQHTQQVQHQQQQQQQHTQQIQHQQGIPQPSWGDQRYQQQTYMPVSASNPAPMGKPAYYTQHHHQQHLIHQMQQQQNLQQQQQQSLPPFQQMSYSQQHHMLPHQQQAFLHSLNPSQQQMHRYPQYPGLSTQESPQQRAQNLHHHHHHQLHQDQQTGRKRKDVNDYMIDNGMAIPVKKPKKKKKKKEPEDPNAPPKPKRNTGLNKPLILSAELSALMDGETELSRPEIVKRLWKHIKGNDLQDPKDRRYILCDDKLKSIFNVDRVNSFGMNRDLSKHLTKKEEVPVESSSSALSTTTSSTTTAATSFSSSTTTTLVDDPPPTTATATTIKQSPTVTADTPEDVVTPQEGENVHLLNNHHNSNGILTSGTVNPITSSTSTATTTSSTASSTPSLH